MSELAKQVARAAGGLEPAWTEERAARLLASIKKQQRVRTQRTGLLRGLAVVGILLAGLAFWRGRGSQSFEELTANKLAVPIALDPLLSERRALTLVDGSLARAEEEGSQLVVREQQASRTVVSLVRGRASFAVVKNPQRLFRVEAGPIAVEVLGTRFSVERLGVEGLPGAQARVTVSEGRVRVLWAAHYAELTAGQSALFPPDPVAPPVPQPPSAAVVDPPAPAPSVSQEPSGAGVAVSHRSGVRRPGAPSEAKKPFEVAPAETDSASAPRPVETKARPSWKELAQDGQFDRAYGEAYGSAEASSEARERAEGPLRTVEKSPGDLLLLADVARLSHHPADAVAPLERVLRVYGQDPRAPLAAFTLGRVLLDELGRPREAAETFARAQQLDPEGPLYQDALAREVEAWSRAGESERARLRAEEYIRRYPKGRRLRSVRRYGEPD